MDISYTVGASPAVAWDRTVNIADSNAATNSDTWDGFLDTHDGVWVGSEHPESLVAAPGGAAGNLTVAGAAQFTPQEVMGGVSAGWVRSPIATAPGAEMDMSIWHVENPSVASLEPGTVLQQSDTTTTWTCVQSGAPGCGGTSNDFVDDVGMQPELLNGEVVTDWYGLTPNGNAQDGNVYGWDITDQSGNGAVAMAPKVTKNPVPEDWLDNYTDYANLSGLWRFEEGSGTTANDESPSANHAQLYNSPVWSTGKLGGALKLDGVQMHGETGYDTGTGGWPALTAAAWVWIDNAAPHIESVFASGWCWTSATQYLGFCIGVHGSNVQFDITTEDGLGGRDLASCNYNPPGDNYGEWMHLAVGFDGANQTMTGYLNGEPVCGDTTGFSIMNTPIHGSWDTIALGITTSNSYPMEGWLDEAVLFDRSLTEQEVRDLYNITAPTQLNSRLVGLWQLGEGAGGTTYDLSGNGNHGTITGASWTTGGRVGAALDLSGGAAISYGNDAALKPEGDMSFFTWLYADSYTPSNVNIMGEHYKQSWLFRVSTKNVVHGQIYYFSGDGASYESCSSYQPDLTAGEWSHAGFVREGTSLKIYVNSIVVISCTLALTPSDGGGSVSSNAQKLIDEVAIWDRALSASEVADLYAGSYRTGEEVTYTSTYGSLAGVETSDGISTVIHLNATYSLPGSDDFPGGQYMPDGDHDFGTDLAGYWPLDEDTGTTAPDHSGNGNAGTITGASWTGGKVGNALDLDGTGDYVTITDSSVLNPTSAITMVAWVFNRDTNTGNQIAKVDQYAMEHFSSGLFGGWINVDGGWRKVESNFVLPTNEWHHITLTYSSSTRDWKLYYDGSLEATTTLSGLSTYDINAGTGNPLRLGRWSAAYGGQDFDGNLDEVAIWDRALNATEVAALYTQQQSAHISVGLPSIEVWSSNTTDFDDASLVATFEEGTDFDLDPVTGLHYIGLTVGAPYAPYWFWTANFTSAGDHTAVIHAAALRMQQFAQPFTLVPSAMSQPSLVWQWQYGDAASDADHERSSGRSYLHFDAPIWPSRDADGDGLGDDGYVFVFGCASGCAVNASYEVWLSQAQRGLDHAQSWVALFDPDLQWFNDTLPASLGMDWLFERGMNYGVTGTAIDSTNDEELSFWVDLGRDVAGDEHVTFMMPFISDGPAFPLVTAYAYAENLSYLDTTSCAPNVAGGTTEFILCSGDTAGPIPPGESNRWDNEAAFLGARYAHVFVDFYSDLLTSNEPWMLCPGCEGEVKIWLFDRNSEFDLERPELFNRAWLGDFGSPPTETVAAFAPYHAAYVDDAFWCMDTPAAPCTIPVQEESLITTIPLNLDATLPSQKFVFPSWLVWVPDGISDGFNAAANSCAAFAVNSLSLKQCAEHAAQTPYNAYEWYSDWVEDFAAPYIRSGSNIPSAIAGSFVVRHIELMAHTVWEPVYTQTVVVSDTITLVVPLIQSMLGQVADLALSMMTFILFLLASSIIIGTTSLLNNALHGRWEVVNHRCASSLAGAAGWLAVIPYVGPGIAAAGRSAATGMQR